MTVLVVAIFDSGTIVLKNLDGEKMPEEGKTYTIWFEEIEPDPIPEFNT